LNGAENENADSQDTIKFTNDENYRHQKDLQNKVNNVNDYLNGKKIGQKTTDVTNPLLNESKRLNEGFTFFGAKFV